MLIEELKVLEAQKDALAKEIEAASGAAAPAMKIQHPKGVSIQVGMGLADNKPRYNAIRVCPSSTCKPCSGIENLLLFSVL